MPSKKKTPKKTTRLIPSGKSLRKAVSYVRSRTMADIKKIRLLWARGMNDAEVREELGLSFREWRRRVRIMKEIPADEEVIAVARRYTHEHNKTISRLESRMKELENVRAKAMEQIDVFDRKVVDKKTKKPKLLYSRPRDMALAASVTRDLVMLDREILRTNQELIALKQRLGLVETYLPQADEDSAFEDAIVVNSPNLMKAWEKREALMKERKKVPMLANGAEVQREEDAVLIQGSNGSSSNQDKTRTTN